MAINLLDMLKDQIGDEVFAQAGKFLGADQSGVKSAMGAALPTILGSMIASGSTPSGSKGLMDMISKGGFDGSVFENLGSAFGGGDTTSSFLNSGSGILKSLLGNKLGSVVDVIASVSGMNKGSSSSIMSMAAPLVMGMVGKYMKSKALDAMGLSKFLGGQSKHVASALPAGMGSLLGFSPNMGMPNVANNVATATKGMGDRVGNVATAATGSAAAAASGGSSLLKRVVPILLLLGLGIFGWNWFQNNNMENPVDGAITNIGATVGDAANAAGDKMKEAGSAVVDGANAAGDKMKEAGSAVVDGAGDVANAAGDKMKEAGNAVADGASDAMDSAAALAKAAADKAKAAIANISFTAGSAGESFSTWLASDESGTKTFQFKNLTFATGSSNIQVMKEVDNVAAVMMAYPSIKIEIGGHTDSRGNAASNMKLSQARADAVKAQLVAKGIDASRITAKGYASTMPVTATPTDAVNRRVEIKATK